MTSQWEAQVVGINYYPTYTTLGQLTAAANDAEAIAVQLEQSGYQTFRVQRLPRQANQKGEWQVDPNEGVKTQELQVAIANLLMPPDGNPPETALFFFSGHGWRKPVDGKDEVFLATSDVLPSERIYGISIGWLGNLIQTSPVKKLIIWLDCCFSGELIDYLPTNKDYCIFTATRSYEPGIEIKHEEGLFTRTLRSGLNPDNYPDGIVDSHKLAKYIQKQMAQTGQAPQCYNSARSILLTSKVTPATFRDRCPYRSLSYFTEQPEDAHVFHGRTKLTLDLIQRVRNKERLIAVFGASGSGKSSLIRAGLLYQLKLGQEIVGSNNWVYCEPFTPTDDPFARLHQAVGIDPPATVPHRRGETEPASNLVPFLKERWGNLMPIIFIVDQFEECFTMCSEQQQKAFVDCLTELIEAIPNLRIVIGMRSDFRSRLREYPQFTQHMKSKVNVGHLNREEIQEAIEKPAEFVGLGIEGSLTQKLINDVEDYPGILPLLQYTLTELWNETRKQGERFLRLATYQGLGGIEGTLEKRADAVYESLLPEERAVAKRIFLELSQVGDNIDIRRRVKLGNLVNSHHSLAILDRVTQKLASPDNRLITRTAIEKAEDLYAAEIILDVVHEALIRHWKQLGEWKRQYQTAMITERKIEAAAQDWQAEGKKTDYLFPGSRLGGVEDYIKDFGNLGMLDGMAEEFIRESQNLRDKLEQKEAARQQRELDILEEKRKAEEKARQEAEKRTEEQAQSNKKLRQRANILKIVLGCAVGIASLAVYFGWDANRQKSIANEQKNIAEVKEQAANVQLQLPIEKNVRPLILALATVGQNQKFARNPFTQVKGSLLDAIDIVRERNIFTGNRKWVDSVAVSVDGKTIVSGGKDGTMRLWNRNGKEIAPPWKEHKNSVRAVAISADGKTIVSGGQDGTVWLRESNGKPIGKPFTRHKGYVKSVAVSADGQTIVSGGEDGIVRVWDRSGKASELPSKNRQGAVYSVAVSADGQTIVSGGADGFVRVWEPNGKAIAPPWKGHKGSVSSVALSADGETIVSGDDDGTVGLWERNGKAIAPLWKGHESEVRVAISADGQTIVSGGQDATLWFWDRNGKPIGQPLKGYQGSIYSVAVSANGQSIVSGGNDVRLWDRNGKAIELPFKGHKDNVNSVSVSKDGKTIVSGSQDGIVQLWDRSSGKAIGRTLGQHQGSVNSVAVSADGQTIVSGGNDSTVRLWDRSGNAIWKSLPKHQGSVNSVAISTDGQTIVSGSDDNTVRLWDRSGNAIWKSLPKHQDYVTSVAVSADGQTIVSGSDDKTVRLWDRSGNAIGLPFQGHEGIVSSVAVSKDGQIIVSGGHDKTLRLWDRSSGKPIGQPFKGHQGYVSSVALSVDGKTIVSGGKDKTVRLWRGVVWQDWVKVGCDRLRLHPEFTFPAKDATEEEKITLQEAVETCLDYGKR
ncbi:caspase family protein [Chamaesiphon sp. VAR_48_metabat_135_sub]|uniref:nSTAND1 domain-containing NTPase n=1 Tax=Chamaesiphon sp. VAR_48_metabat_135_sub TaxID=2964699 RepID=UPI00286C4781|nr:caspase family protein [Chamaesiphon sp. VAR_48_metabat_135_sub]